jgi:hypothetical protein
MQVANFQFGGQGAAVHVVGELLLFVFFVFFVVIYVV